MRSSLVGALALAVATSGVGPAATSAQEWRDFRVARQAGGVQSLDVELLYGAGRLSVEPSEAPFLYDARVRYDTERFQPVRAWEVDGDHGRFRLALTSVDDETSSATIRLEEWDVDFDLDDLRGSGNELGELEFELHPRIPTRLRLGVGAARSRLEMGGLSLSSLEILTGASETDLTFSDPNRVPMSELVIKAGAADFEAEGLGNARFERLEFKGAIGDVSLDFSGEWTRDATANITMGVGELAIRVPEEIAVRIVRSSLLIKLDAPGFERLDRSYVTPNWDTAEIHLEIELEAAFGTVEVERF